MLLHPVGLDLTYWGAQIEALVDEYDVIALDLPGHGRSPSTPADWTFERAAATVAEVIRAAGGEPAHIVGLSVGSFIAQTLALAEPALVRSLTLIGTAATFSDNVRAGMRSRAETVREKGMAAVIGPTVQRWFRPETVARRPDLVDRVTRTLLADDPLVHAAMWDTISGFDTAADLERVACPTLIVVGEDDPSTPPAAAQVVHARIAGSEVHVVAEASHMTTLERPDAVNAHLVRFLAPL